MKHINEANADINCSDKKVGFVGKAFIYDEEMYINTFTGYGFDRVIKKMGGYINWYSGKIRLSGFDRSDIKQLIIVILLDGIRRYNPTLNIKLSTFLYVHIKNRMISRIKEETKQSSNATCNDGLCKIVCKCGYSSTVSTKNICGLVCIACKIKVDSTWIIRPEHNQPLSFDAIIEPISEAESKGYRTYYNDTHNIMSLFDNTIGIDSIERKLDFANVFSGEDKATRKIAELMYYDDYSITEAAREVGLTCWAASLRLKRLKSKSYIKEHFYK